jgi:tetratricopeptide (TPR) repeat protein
MEGIRQLSRKEKSPYKPLDIWTNEDHALFLKYCPEKRDRCYHAMASDTSCRPHELLSLRIKDIVFKLSSTKKQYAEVHITNSKTKPRTLPLIFSIPYIKDWIDSHPKANNPNSFLFISLADSNYGEQLSENSLYKQYSRTYRKRYYPKLIDDSIPDVDKSMIRNLLTKPWNPYILRHSALTVKSQILKESTLRDHAGWTLNSKMPTIYIHYFGNESAKSLLEAYGIENYHDWHINILKSKTCPNCNEPNKVESKFCLKCKMVLTYNEYLETVEKQKEKEDEIMAPAELGSNVRLGNNLLSIGEYSSAIKTFDVIIKNSTDDELTSIAWNNKAQCFRMLSRHRDELSCIDMALKYKKDARYLSNKILCLESLGRNKEIKGVRKQLARLQKTNNAEL